MDIIYAILEVFHMEAKFLEILTDANHVYLCLGIMAFLYILKLVKPIDNAVFQTNWKYIIPLFNMILSFLGIFALSMTPATEIGTKIVIAILITAVTSFGYQSFVKPFESFVKHFIDKNEKNE